MLEAAQSVDRQKRINGHATQVYCWRHVQDNTSSRVYPVMSNACMQSTQRHTMANPPKLCLLISSMSNAASCERASRRHHGAQRTDGGAAPITICGLPVATLPKAAPRCWRRRRGHFIFSHLSSTRRTRIHVEAWVRRNGVLEIVLSRTLQAAQPVCWSRSATPACT